MRVPLFQVDAFTSQPFTGNPAAVCPLDRWLDDELLRKVAAENNLSETAFLVPRGADYQLRWFTPRCEVKLCGHATLASAYVIFNRLKPESKSVRFATRFSGTLTVWKEDDLFLMDFPAMACRTCAGVPAELVRALGARPLSVELAEGNDDYIAVYETEGAIRNIRPDFAQLEQLHPFAVAITAPAENADFVSRYFAPSYGIAEDPVTGSVHCALAPYWAERLGKTHLHARQVSQRGGELWCEIAGERVILKGNAVVAMEGVLAI
jgi:PhzF family phenazine biosynthesis protein